MSVKDGGSDNKTETLTSRRGGQGGQGRRGRKGEKGRERRRGGREENGRERKQGRQRRQGGRKAGRGVEAAETGEVGEKRHRRPEAFFSPQASL